MHSETMKFIRMMLEWSNEEQLGWAWCHTCEKEIWSENLIKV